MIAGVFVNGSAKKVVVRASSVDGILNPKLTIKSYPAGTVLFSNTDWVTGISAAELRSTENGKWMPGKQTDAALIVTLQPGLYTMEVAPESSPGVGIIEVYELNTTAKLGGISTRSYVGTNPSDYMIAGVFVQGDPKKLIVRGSSVDGVLNPKLTIKSYPDGKVLFENTDWVSGVSASELRTLENGKWKPARESDATLIVTLNPGLYTLEVSPESSPGVGIVEVYEHPLFLGNGTTPTITPTSDAYSTFRQQCINTVNQFRATLNLPALQRWTEQESCVDGEAKGDSEKNQAHANFGKCQEMAQNECPGYSSLESINTTCLKQMWNEGPGEPYSAHGHYINMTGNYTKVACGFYKTSSGNIWAIQNFR
jgi:hypothetical protein